MHLPPDWGIFGALIVSFLVFWSIFGRLFFAPFLRLISDRERRLKELSERTERLLAQQKIALEQRAAELAELRRVALSEREAERRSASERAAELIEAARSDARDELDRLRASIEAEFVAAEQQLGDLARTLAAELASRVLERPVSNGQVPLDS
jgi:F0F1-type ATP synthase membrane subunit b/b'